MKKILGLFVLGIAIVGIGKAVSVVRQGSLLEKMEALMESCPPIQALRRLEEQNTEVIGLLRDQNAMLWKKNSTEKPISKAG